MKVLIWFLALLANALVVTSLQMFCDASLGAIPTVIIFLLITVFPARHFCRKWDARKNQKKELETPVDSQKETAKAESENTVHSEAEAAEPKSVSRMVIYTQLPRWRRPVAWLVTFAVWMLMEYLIRLLITLCGSAIVYLESLSTVAVVVIVLVFGSLAVGILLMPLMYGPLLVAQLSESIYPSRSGSRFLIIAGLSLLGSLIGFILGFSGYMVFGSGVAKVTWFVSYGYCFICAVILFIFGAKHEEAEEIKPASEDFSVTTEPVDPEYGTIAKKPIHVRGVDGEKRYLDALQTESGQKLRYDRWGSLLVEGIDRPVDIYHLFLPSGEQYKTLYLYMYADKNDEMVPEGFISTNQKVRTSKQEKPKTKIPEILAVVFGILLIGSIGVNIWQYYVAEARNAEFMTIWDEAVIKYQQLQTDYDNQVADFEKQEKQLNRVIDSKDEKIRELNGKILGLNLDVNHMEPILDFYQENAVFVVSGNKKYHTYGCLDIAGKSCWIYNVENAEYQGYKPCPKCR